MDSYFKVISDSIQAQSKLIAEFFRTHPGENGRNKEAVLLNFFKNYLPKRYSLSTGFIASSDSSLSNQNDIIIYDSFWSAPLFPEIASQVFPIESVYAVIEVKSLLNKNELHSTVEKATKVKNMTMKGIKRSDSTGIEKPCYCLFAYDSTDLVELKQYLCDLYQDVELDKRMDFILVLNKGLIYTGSYYGIVKYGEPNSLYRLGLGPEDLAALKETNPSEIGGMMLKENTLYVYYMFLMSYLSFSGHKIVNWLDYLKKDKDWGDPF